MFPVRPEDESEVLGDCLEREWKNEVQRTTGTTRTPSLVTVLFRIFGLKYILYNIICVLEEMLNIIQPILLGGFISYFSPQPGISKTWAYLFALGISICAFLKVVAHHPHFFLVSQIGMKIKVACCSLMYRKCLRLSHVGLSKTTSGQIVNLMSNDINKIDLAVIYFPFLFIGPIQVIAVLVYLWKDIGVHTLAGLAMIIVLVAIQGMTGRLFAKFREKTAKYSDKRIAVMNEVIAGIRIIKLYCWEKPFADLIASIRRSELHQVRMSSYLSSLFDALLDNGRYVCVYAVVLAYFVDDQRFRASDLYVTVGLLNVLSTHIMLFLTRAITETVELAVTFKRIARFLLLEELGTRIRDDKTVHCLKADPKVIETESASAKWDESSILMVVLGELPLIEGRVYVNGQIGYVSQQPWVISGTVQENIVFGEDFEETKYNEILKACALDKDLTSFPYGDDTLIGDRGVKLSGGQRARISLARALYREASVYLLDDPFSAVDINVARHIFEKVILGRLKDNSKILVTHSVHFLPAADQIIILKKGKVIGSGTLEDLCSKGVDFTSIVKPEQNFSKSKKKTMDDLVSWQQTSTTFMHRKTEDKTDHSLPHFTSDTSNDIQISRETLAKTQIPKEEIQKGTVNWRVYKDYFKSAAGIFKSFALAFICIITQIAFITSDWWLSRWANENEVWLATNDSYDTKNGSFQLLDHLPVHSHLMIYTGITCGLVLLSLLRGFFFFHVALAAAQKLHNTMFTSIIRSRVSFFDVNPVGRILNRFSKDIGQIDETLPQTFFGFIQSALIILGMVGMTGVVNPWIFIAIVPLGGILILIRQYNIRTARQLQRLEGITRSPVFTHLSETLQGLHTIRASGIQGKFIKTFDANQDLHTAAYFLVLATLRWLAIRLDLLCAVFMSLVVFGCVFAAESLDAGLVGVSMTYAISVTGLFQWTVRQSSMVENKMVSVERVLDYSSLPPEASLETEENQSLPLDWPQRGEISATKVSMKYQADLPYILHEITFHVKPEEKVGIIGRTGAGKSSLVAMLMRVVEFEGTVKIDNRNIQDIGLHDLRSNISIIPQDPVLFTGKLRRNLDPFGDHNDTALWNVLMEVEMKQAIQSLHEGLDTEVSEGGINFSVGQRQLICLARAMLRKNKILIIDEATANVDTVTDHLIQKTIREKFFQCTVLTIAHRLNTVMDSDRIMVIDQGRIIEFDDPYILLKKPNGFLHNLVQHADIEATTELVELAKTSYIRRASVFIPPPVYDKNHVFTTRL